MNTPSVKKSDLEKLGSTFCVMPWTNLATETDGKCKICCVVMTNRYIKKSDGSDFHIHSDRIDDIWNSEYLKNVRKRILNGEWVDDCFYCRAQENSGSKSPRQDYNDQWFSDTVHETVLDSKDLDYEVRNYPQSLEPRPGITCNLKCTMCWSKSSSKILKERKASLSGSYGELPQFLRDEWEGELRDVENSNFRWSEDSIYLENLRKCLPGLKRFYFTGGEPTLIKSNLTALKELLAQGKTDLLVSYTTNMSVSNSEMLELASQFERTEVLGSIDALGAANDYIRFPCKWADVVRNMDEILSRGNVGFSVMAVVQILNVVNFVDLVIWLSLQYRERDIRVLPTILNGPDYLLPTILPPRLKEQAIARYDDALKNPVISAFNKERLNDVRARLLADEPRSELLRERFKSYIKFNDHARGTNFALTFPELTPLLEVPN